MSQQRRREEAIDTLTKARALIEQGWLKGDMQKQVFGRTCYCALGAINAVSLDLYAGHSANYNSKVILSKVIGDHRIDHWNDAPERTKDEVLEAFGRAIEAAHLIP